MPLRDHFRPPVDNEHSWDELHGMPSALYAVTARGRKRFEKRPLLDTWFYPLMLGQSLPTLPIWLDADLGVFLDLETSYESACQAWRGQLGTISHRDGRLLAVGDEVQLGNRRP